jgi:hypothetical protein
MDTQGLERDLPVSTGVVPTEIFCMNKEVDDKNEHELKKLPLPAQVTIPQRAQHTKLCLALLLNCPFQ